jgi:hypothetical protein
VKSLLGKHVKILLKNVVKLETKGDKTENRVLVSFKSVISVCEMFSLFIRYCFHGGVWIDDNSYIICGAVCFCG